MKKLGLVGILGVTLLLGGCAAEDVGAADGEEDVGSDQAEFATGKLLCSLNKGEESVHSWLEPKVKLTVKGNKLSLLNLDNKDAVFDTGTRKSANGAFTGFPALGKGSHGAYKLILSKTGTVLTTEFKDQEDNGSSGPSSSAKYTCKK